MKQIKRSAVRYGKISIFYSHLPEQSKAIAGRSQGGARAEARRWIFQPGQMEDPSPWCSAATDTYISILLERWHGSNKSNKKQVRSKTYKAQGALTAASKNNESTNTMKTVSEARHKTSKINLRNLTPKSRYCTKINDIHSYACM